MLFSSEVPIEAPSCWPTLRVAEATPASCGATPKVPALMAGANTRPAPIPPTMIGPSTPPAHPECAPEWAKPARPPGRGGEPGRDDQPGPDPRHQHDGGQVGRDDDADAERQE